MDELQRYLRVRLPDYMVPSAVVVLDELPLLSNGKVNRKALPLPDQSRPELERAYVAPRNETESALAAIWSDVLGVERVGVEDNFFALGGDSIRSIQVLAKAREANLGLTLQQLFQYQTIGELSVMAGQGAAEEAVARTEPWSLVSAEDREKLPEDVVDAYPLAELQAGMLFHSAYSPETAVYHDVFSCRIRTALDEGLLREAIGRVLSRHAVLRTSFALSGYSQPLQLVHAEVAVPLSVEDLQSLSAAEQASAVEAWMEAEKQRAFDWTEGPLLRFQVHRFGAERFQLTLSFHHAIADGWSVATMLAELFGQYGALMTGDARGVPPAPELTYRDFVALERSALESEATRAYWDADACGPLGAATAASARIGPCGPDGPVGRGHGAAGPRAFHGPEVVGSEGGRSSEERAFGGPRAGHEPGGEPDGRVDRPGVQQPSGRIRWRAGVGPVFEHAAFPLRVAGFQLAGAVPGRVRCRAGPAAPPPLPHGPLAAQSGRGTPVRDGLQLQPFPRVPRPGGSRRRRSG